MTVDIGRMNNLPLVRTDDNGGFLSAGEYGEVFLPNSQIPEGIHIGDPVEVFCYMDDGRLTVTAHRPKALLGEMAKLEVKDVTPGAAYMEWGIRKDLMVPFKEQKPEFKVGDKVVVYVAMDRDGRLFGTTRYNRYISDFLPENSTLKAGDRVHLMPISKTPLGIKMVINNRYYGLLPSQLAVNNDVHYGVKLKGFIQSIRQDRKINISLYQGGQEGIQSASQFILSKLKEAGGHLPYNDHSDPKEIEAALGMSKGKFKKVIGSLYKERKILLDDDGITLLA